MTPAGWLRDHTRDGRITVLIDGRVNYIRIPELVDLYRGALRAGATVANAAGIYSGTVTASGDGSRYWLDIGARRFFVWCTDLERILQGTGTSVPLREVHGMTPAPVLSAGRPLHA